MPAGSSLTAKQRTLRARLAAYTRWSREDGRAGTAAARSAFLDGFEREVDPDGRLSADERRRRAEAARRAHMTRLALQSSRARRRTASS